ncbi:MAG: hypothetical protein K6E28_02540 [Eubacterium sp.]|nr:hypothetical protein [Eubacterium sp.]
MKEQENILNNVNEAYNPENQFEDAMKGLPMGAFMTRPEKRGYSLSQLINFLYVPKTENGVERELTGDELDERVKGFKQATALKRLTDKAFNSLNDDKLKEFFQGDGNSLWDRISIDGKSASELWSKKFENVKDATQRNYLYQLELLNQVMNGTSEITVKTVADKEPVQVLPVGPRDAIRKEANKNLAALKVEEPKMDEEMLLYDEEEKAPEQAAEPEKKQDPLSAEVFDVFKQEAPARLWRNDHSIGQKMPTATLVNALFNGRNNGAEIVSAYDKFPEKDQLNLGVESFLKEFDGPERKAFLKENGLSFSKTVRVGGQSLEERYGDKYKDIENEELKEKLYKFELVNEITAAHLKGKKGVVPEISVATFEVEPNGNVKVAGSMSVTVNRHIEKKANNDVYYDIELEMDVMSVPKPQVASAYKEPEKREKYVETEENLIFGPAEPVDPNARLSEESVAKWEYGLQIRDLHEYFKNSLQKLNSEKKNSLLGEDTGLYADMKKALENCIKFTDPSSILSFPSKVADALETYSKAAKDYYDNRKGIFGPRTDAGKIRLKEAKDASEKIPGEIAKINAFVDKLGSKYKRYHVRACLEEALVEDRKIGKNSLSLDDFNGAFGVEFNERAAEIYLDENNKAEKPVLFSKNDLKKFDKKHEVTKEEIFNLAVDEDFASILSTYPINYDKKYDEFLAAKDFIKDHFSKIANDKTLDKDVRENANMMTYGTRLSNHAWKLLDNEEFLKIYHANPNTYKELFERKIKAEAYLTVNQGKKPTEKEVSELSNNKIFRMVSGKNPTDYANQWDDVMHKADLMQIKYKEELDALTEGLDNEYRGGVVTFVKDEYKASDKENPAYEKALENLGKIKEEINDEKYRIYDAKQELKDEPDSPEKNARKEQLDKEADNLDKRAKSYKNAKRDAVIEHLLPEYVARVAFLKATQDPKAGKNICRLMVTAPKQEKEVQGKIMKNLQSPEGKKLLHSNKLTEMVLDGKIVEKIVPGAKKSEPEKKAPVQGRNVERNNPNNERAMGR